MTQIPPQWTVGGTTTVKTGNVEEDKREDDMCQADVHKRQIWGRKFIRLDHTKNHHLLSTPSRASREINSIELVSPQQDVIEWL